MRLSWAQFGHNPDGLLLDQLIRLTQQRLRNRQAEGLGGLEVDHELKHRPP